MVYWNALWALLALMWSWALKDDPPSDDDPPGDDTEDKDDDKETKPFVAFATQKEHDDYLERMLKERLERKDKKQADEKAETERLAREKALEEQGEHKAIAEQRQETIVQKDATIAERDARIAELEGQVESLGTHRKANEERVAALMKDVPESVKELLSDRDPLKQLEWLDKNPELAGLKAPDRGPRGSRETGRQSRTNGNQPDEKAESRQRQTTKSAF